MSVSTFPSQMESNRQYMNYNIIDYIHIGELWDIQKKSSCASFAAMVCVLCISSLYIGNYI